MSDNYRFATIVRGGFPGIFVLLLALVAGACTTNPNKLEPTLRYEAASQGCGNVMVYKFNPEHTEVILVEANREVLGLGTTEKTFALDSTPTGLRVQIDMYARRPQNPRYCNDVLSSDDPAPAQWRARKGTVSIVLDNNTADFNVPYKATVKVENAVFFDRDNRRHVFLKEVIFKDVMVGWLPG